MSLCKKVPILKVWTNAFSSLNTKLVKVYFRKNTVKMSNLQVIQRLFYILLEISHFIN